MAKISPLVRRMFNPKHVKFILIVVAIINALYLASLYLGKGPTLPRWSSSILRSGKISGGQSSLSQQAMPITSTVENGGENDQLTNGEKQNNDKSTTSPMTKKLYDIPKKPYDELTDAEKILDLLNQVTLDKQKYWLAHTELTHNELQIRVHDFLPQNWVDRPTVFYDPRFTLAVYVSEIKNQYLRKNPENKKFKIHEIVVPFAWSDWVDLTMLNEELVKPESSRKNCEYMKAVHHIPAKDPNYCVNNADLTEQDLEEMALPSTKFVPGFAVKKSPTNKASNEIRMWEGKSHLLTYAKNPLAMIILSKDGVYEAKIDTKKRIVDSDLFENYLRDNEITYDDPDTSIIMDPVKEFLDLSNKVLPNPLDPEDDEYGMVAKIKETNPDVSRELYLPDTAFDYRQDKIDKQIAEYQERIDKLHDLTRDELAFDQHSINLLRLTRNEKLYFDGLKYANQFPIEKEQTYFRMARLIFDVPENDKDAGWHYEWRFFNGALRYLKKGWNQDELLIREKVLLDRILRNWFRFANEKGIISWIAHGPLLSWYWDGLLFPFDEDIDIQMPAEELARFSKLYNQTLVIEEITEGFGKYFIDCSTFIHHRGKSYKENHIDARFIDIDTGSYIDITGLGVSDEPAPEKYSEMIAESERAGEVKKVYNCRNLHFSLYNELLPLRFTMMGGVPLYIPNRIEEILRDEYSQGMTSYTYEGFFFVDAINLWIHYLKLEFLFPDHKYYKEDGALDTEVFSLLVRSMGDAHVLKLLQKDEDILLEYYLTKDVTELHRKELTYLFDMPHGEKTLMGDVGHQRAEDEVSNNVEYHRLTSQFKFQKPFRRPLFNYEHIDKPAHHRD